LNGEIVPQNASPIVPQSTVRSTAQIAAQIAAQKLLLSSKWQAHHYIAYFQSFTNTYDSPMRLKARYDEALLDSEIEGLAIATRADCIDAATIALLKSYRSLPVFWVELGLQTVKATSRDWLRLHQSVDVVARCVKDLHNAGIPVVLHVIAGLPGETKADFLNTIAFVNQMAPFGIKVHMLNVLRGTKLGHFYNETPFELLSRETYIEWVADALTALNPDITIHRLTGDGPRELLVAPRWIRDKRAVLNGIEKYLREHDMRQGCRYHNEK
jgi:radical SAM protein (TIGR01212 family)